jgi:hypothetical protein
MKLHIIGLEGSSGISGKSGKAYDMGSIHSVARLAAPYDESGVAVGTMGTTYRCSSALIKSLAHNPLPFIAEVQVEDVMKFGKREQEVISVTPEKQAEKPR